MQRFKTDYPGIFYREADRIGGKGKEKVYYVVFKKDGKVYEEKVGRQYADDMTPAKAAMIRAEVPIGVEQPYAVMPPAAAEAGASAGPSSAGE